MQLLIGYSHNRDTSFQFNSRLNYFLSHPNFTTGGRFLPKRVQNCVPFAQITYDRMKTNVYKCQL